MTADQRLDQLEPLLSETMTILDRHTAQLKQITNTVGQLTALATQQSDNITFLLREHIIVKNDVMMLRTDVTIMKNDVTTMKTDVDTMKNDVDTMKTDVATMKSDITELKQGQFNTASKLDLILSKLQ